MPTVKLICTYLACTAHRLYRDDWSEEQNLKVFGKCANTHGHHYTVKLHFTGEVNPETGMVINGYDIEEIVKPFFSQYFDHKFLNEDVPFFKDHLPTAEWIAYWVYEELKDKFGKEAVLDLVEIQETPELAVVYPHK